MNILLALRLREQTGRGCKLDVSMTDGLFAFLYWAMGNAAATGAWPRPGGELLSGGSARYQIYRTKDGRYLAAAPLEDKFWRNFCEAIELPEAARDDGKDPAATIRSVREIIAQRNAEEWTSRFSGKDVCANVVRTLKDAMAQPQFVGRGLFRRSVVSADYDALPAVAVPVCEPLRDARTELRYPRLGESNELLARSSG
jgi:crotonobetainyl-CoA:carnitine CoA-transferase CaiB-like acyl-CoA transferase